MMFMMLMMCYNQEYHMLSKPPTCPLRPVMGNNACPPRITAAAGTEFVNRPVTWGTDYIIISPSIESYKL